MLIELLVNNNTEQGWGGELLKNLDAVPTVKLMIVAPLRAWFLLIATDLYKKERLGTR